MNEDRQPNTQDAIEPYRLNCFLSLPHELSTVREGLKNVIRRLGSEASFVTQSEGDRLRPEIKRKLANSAILIADLSSSPGEATTSGPRPAVMWEIGFAEASEMRAIYLCQAAHRATNVPAILSEEHLILYDLHKLNTALEDVERVLKSIILSDRTAGSSVFRSRCYVDRASCELEARYMKARDTIRILELNLETVEAQVPVILRSLEKNPELSLQILTLNPFSEFAAARADQLAGLPLPYRKRLISYIKETYTQLGAIDRERWGLRIYDTFPTQIMFQIDDAIFHSIISLGRQSRGMLHFEVRRARPNAATTFEAHYATLWNRSMEYEDWEKRNRQDIRRLVGSNSEPKSQRAAARRRKSSSTKGV